VVIGRCRRSALLLRSWRWATAPVEEETTLGYWWLWYDSSASDKLGVNEDPALIPVVQTALDDDQLISFNFRSPGYTTHYYTKESSDSSKHPKLFVTY